MEFNITGNIREKESGLGVMGLMIRAYDKDLFYDDLLGTAITGDEGRFEMVYTEKDFRELFEHKPDIYLSVYAPPYRFLIDTKEAVRWCSSAHEHFELEIDRKTLGNIAPTLPDDQVEGGISLPKNAIIIEKRVGFDIPKLPGFSTVGIPGSPALPEQMQYVALPLGGDILSLKVIKGDAIRLPEKMNPLPAQNPVPVVGTDPKQFDDGYSIDNVDITFTPPDPKYFEGKRPYPEKLVELERVEEIGAMQIAAVRIRPLQFDPRDRTFIFYPNLHYNVKFDREKAKRLIEKRDKKEIRVGQYYAETVNALLQQNVVVSARDIFGPWVLVDEEVPHVIITDNYAWPELVDRGDGTTRAPNLSERGAALPGDQVTEFERLAEWKTSRGMRSRVVTISEIVDGKFGDFTEGNFARDLQEVLRNFFKHIHNEWDTLYILLAGDVNVVPIRRLVGSRPNIPEVGCLRTVTDNPPPRGKCYFVSGRAVVKLHTTFIPANTDPLSTFHGGIRLPFDRDAASGRLGWYYTNEADFMNLDEGFTRLPAGQTSRYIIVEGPESIIDDDYYWVRDDNSIPSDFYYASLVGTDYSIPGKHDFDSNNNGLYGQYTEGVILDAVGYWSDVWVGRASVESGDQARAFVDKVITYERLETPDGATSVDPTYLQKILYASAYWGLWRHFRQLDISTPPEAGKFTHEAGTTVTKIHTKPYHDIELVSINGMTFPSYHLVAVQGTSKTVIPYNTAANASNPGWFFTTDDTYNTQSASETHFVKVLGPETDIDPGQFFWDPVGLELSVEQKENLRQLMDIWYPNFQNIERHYEDYFDLSPPPPLVPLESTTIRNALDNGVHFASLSGHGNPYGCCRIDILSQPDFTNNRHYFIMFADSCKTARPDGYDSLAEISTIAPNGGAVAYVGYTRWGFVGFGDNHEQCFWSILRDVGRLGPAAGLRLATEGVGLIWSFYTQTLFGDPEMPVWTDIPSVYEVTHPDTAIWGDIITVTVCKLGIPLMDHRVTLMGGWENSSVRPRIFMTKTTNSFGQASFQLPLSGTAPEGLNITVSHANFKPYVGMIEIEGGGR